MKAAIAGSSGNLTIDYLPIESLIANPRNAREHPHKQLKALKTSVSKFGFLVPILVNDEKTIVAGHARFFVAKELDFESVPVIYVGHLTLDQQRAFMIADNRLTEMGKWNEEKLAAEFEYLRLHTDLVMATGFELPKIDLIIQNNFEDMFAGADGVPDPMPVVVSQEGDLWVLDRHRIYCGNALKEVSYKKLMGEEQAQMVFMDVPYNVPIQGHASGLGKIQHENFAMAAGEMSEEDFIEFLSRSFELATKYSLDGSIHFVCMDWRHLYELLTAGRAHYTELKNLCVWNKDNGGMGALYRSKHELVFVFKHGRAPHINNVSLGRHGRYRTNVWQYAGANSFSRKTEEGNLLAMHPTVKPLALVADAILDCSERDGLILDPFGGSGTTLLAAEKTGRRARLIELDAAYVDVTVRRWQEFTGKQAIHAASGFTFDEIQSFVESLEVRHG